MSQNSKFDVESHYFSGQGVVTIGVMDPVTKRAKYYVPAGNVTDLKVNISTSVIDHKGSQDGQRAIDKRVQTETKATATMTIENWNRTNISKALRGDGVRIPGATVTDAALVLYRDGVVPVDHLSLSSVSLKQGATTLVAFVDDATAYDYKVNLDAGSFRLNDGSKVGFSSLGTAATAITVGATTQITVANTAAVGDEVYLQGFTGADASLLNNKWHTVTAATGTALTISTVTTGKTITTTGSPKVVFNGTSLLVTYTYADQYRVDALTQPLTDISIRFEGLNTAEENSPVVVELFKFAADPLKELSLISDTIGQFQLEGALLYDASRSTGSKFFSMKKLTGNS